MLHAGWAGEALERLAQSMGNPSTDLGSLEGVAPVSF
jgi:hypothetical protein